MFQLGSHRQETNNGGPFTYRGPSQHSDGNIMDDTAGYDDDQINDNTNDMSQLQNNQMAPGVEVFQFIETYREPAAENN